MNFLDIFSNKILICAASSWFIAQFLKVIIYLLLEKEFRWERFHGSGGMPSSHAATVVGLCLAVGYGEGFDSALFAVSFILAIIVMHDASRVRKSVGDHAKLLNEKFEEAILKAFNNKAFKELVGHKPMEVFVGAVLGAIVSTLLYFNI